MCNMFIFWLILILRFQILRILDPSMLKICSFLYFNGSLRRISSFTLKNTLKYSVPLRHCFINNTLSHNFKSQLYNTPNRSFITQTNPKIPKHFEDKISRRLDTSTSNPIGIISHLVQNFFDSYEDVVISNRKFKYTPFDFESVSITDNFDELQVPLDHVSRDPKDTYYLDTEYIEKYKEIKDKSYSDIINSDRNGVYSRDLIDSMATNFKHSQYKMLPTHTTSHITKLLREGLSEGLYSGQVFRRDEIDSQHYPVFHQMDGYLLFTKQDIENLRQLEGYKNLNPEEVILKHLKNTLENLVEYLYGYVKFVPKNPTHLYQKPEYSDLEKKWDDEATFPFTFPSSEFYLKNEGELTELLGCGVLKNLILQNNSPGFPNSYVGGWAFGMGLERLAMVLCKISDIRQFWETDERYLKQYQDVYSKGILPIFNKYSKNPPVIRDLSFYLSEESEKFDEEQFKKIILENGKGFVEEVEFVSSYFNEKLNKKSLCYRVCYRAFQENLTNNFVNSIHDDTSKVLQEKLKLTIR